MIGESCRRMAVSGKQIARYPVVACYRPPSSSPLLSPSYVPARRFARFSLPSRAFSSLFRFIVASFLSFIFLRLRRRSDRSFDRSNLDRPIVAFFRSRSVSRFYKRFRDSRCRFRDESYVSRIEFLDRLSKDTDKDRNRNIRWKRTGERVVKRSF